ncbi:MAG: WecB/TagA/CpsF family glycosyltransferase [Ilumatobacteraceae bacterium]|nr:WecB/TagA/CpsF family glycosyltransferase [Acidimicrobiales bacterium]MCB9392331.1 WecB/TagA/CpsF family glycosyltransferase [Acidimicrobiaceae bacterium]
MIDQHLEPAVEPTEQAEPSPAPHQARRFRRIPLLNVEIDDMTMDDLLALRSGSFVTLHVDMLGKLQRDRSFYEIWPTFQYVTCDSQFLVFAMKLMGRPVRERVSGSDFLPRFYTQHANDPDTTIFLFGAAPGIAEVAAEKINAKVGRQIVVGTASPPFDLVDGSPEDDAFVEQIIASGATVVVVGLAAGRQEKWIASHRDRLPGVRLILPLGGTIDYEAGSVKRPPAWVTNVGLEWFWRLAREPKRRFRRYVIEQPRIIPALVKDHLGRYRNPFA